MPKSVSWPGMLSALAGAMLLCASCERPAAPAPDTLRPLTPGPGEVKLKKAEKPQKPPEPKPRVRIHRSKDGSYSWDITGEDVSAIIRADRELRGIPGSEPREAPKKGGQKEDGSGIPGDN